jgi:hypothetical protein
LEAAGTQVVEKRGADERTRSAFGLRITNENEENKEDGLYNVCLLSSDEFEFFDVF